MRHNLYAVDSPLAEPATDVLDVVIADGHRLVRAGFKALIEAHADMRVVAEAATGDEALTAALTARPDVVLLDMELPHGGGVEAARRILALTQPGQTRVLMLFGSASDAAVFDALRAGATGLLLKDSDRDDLIDAVRVVAAGDAVLAPPLARTLVADFLSRPERLRPTPEQLDELTPREREVVALVACGLSNEEIAERLVVTRATAKTHVSRALCKLHARDRAQLVVLAYEAGLVRPGVRRQEAPARIGAPVPAGRLDRVPPGGPVRRPALRSVAA